MHISNWFPTDSQPKSSLNGNLYANFAIVVFIGTQIPHFIASLISQLVDQMKHAGLGAAINGQVFAGDIA